MWEPLRLRLITLSRATAQGSGHPHCPLLCQTWSYSKVAVRAFRHRQTALLPVPRVESCKEEKQAWKNQTFNESGM